MSENNISSEVQNNMRIHYTGLLKEGTKTLGSDFMAKSIFSSIDTNKDNILSNEEIEIGKENIDNYINKSVEEDNFYANLNFGKNYTEGLKNVDKNSTQTPSEQIIEQNLNFATNKILQYATEHPEDAEIQKYANKLREIINNGNLKLLEIPNSTSVAGRAEKENGEDVILIDNRNIIGNLNKNSVLQVLLHELRHTMEKDTLNSKAEELEAEETARRLAKKLNPVPQWNEPIDKFLDGYNVYAQASPGTYNIPVNTGISVWYEPKEVIQKDNILTIKSDALEKLNQGHIEEYVTFGTEKDEDGNPFPISAIRKIFDADGNVISTQDYGEYNREKRAFNYFKVRMQQIKLENSLNPSNILKFSE